MQMQMQNLVKLQRRVDMTYLTLIALRGSHADYEGLAREGAWVCWRVRRLLRMRQCDSSANPGWVTCMLAGWRARALLWGARPMHDFAAARLVRAQCVQILLDLQRQRASFTPGWQAESLTRRVQELERLVRDSLALEDDLQTQVPPIWHSFIADVTRAAR